MKSLIALAIFMGLAVWSPGYGRIGETIGECIARYGEIDSGSEVDGRQAQVFKKSGYIIVVCFYEKKADWVTFLKEKEDDLGFASEISDNEIEILLKSNSDDTPWKPIEIISMNKHWVTIDKSLISMYSYLENTLSIMTLDCFYRFAAKKKADEEKSLDGF